MASGSYYGVVFPEFWTGPTGRAIRRLGGKDAQLLALYLMSARHANLIGLYYLPVEFVRQDVGLSERSIAAAMLILSGVEFAEYDAGSEFVWIREMARFRLGLSDRRPTLDEDDNRVPAVNRVYHGIPDNPFLGEFFKKYARTLRLKKRRDPVTHHNISPLQRGLEGASEPLISQITDHRDQEDQDQQGSDHVQTRARDLTIRQQKCPQQRTHAYCGRNFHVSLRQHDLLERELGPLRESFDLLAWYHQWDALDEPIDNLLSWLKGKIASERQRMPTKAEQQAWLLRDNWLTDCQQKHGGTCNGMRTHYTQCQIDAATENEKRVIDATMITTATERARQAGRDE